MFRLPRFRVYLLLLVLSLQSAQILGAGEKEEALKSEDEDPCSFQPCSEHGFCEQDPDSEVGYECVCHLGFHGPTCGQQVEECEHQPCVNDGECDATPEGFKCTCSEGFFGRFCQLDEGGQLAGEAVGRGGESLLEVFEELDTTQKSEVASGVAAFFLILILALVAFVLYVYAERRRLLARYASAIELGVKEDVPPLGWFSVALTVITTCCGLRTMVNNKDTKTKIPPDSYFKLEARDVDEDGRGMSRDRLSSRMLAHHQDEKAAHLASLTRAQISERRQSLRSTSGATPRRPSDAVHHLDSIMQSAQSSTSTKGGRASRTSSVGTSTGERRSSSAGRSANPVREHSSPARRGSNPPAPHYTNST